MIPQYPMNLLFVSFSLSLSISFEIHEVCSCFLSEWKEGGGGEKKTMSMLTSDKNEKKKKRNEKEKIFVAISVALVLEHQAKNTWHPLSLDFCTPVNTRTYYLQDLLLTMVIFVLLIWLWVWCNAVAGYFVPYPFPFVPTSRQNRDLLLLQRTWSERRTLRCSPFISDDVPDGMVNETLLYGPGTRTRDITNL